MFYISLIILDTCKIITMQQKLHITMIHSQMCISIQLIKPSLNVIIFKIYILTMSCVLKILSKSNPRCSVFNLCSFVMLCNYHWHKEDGLNAEVLECEYDVILADIETHSLLEVMAAALQKQEAETAESSADCRCLWCRWWRNTWQWKVHVWNCCHFW